MKKYYIIIGVIVLILMIGYFTNWFGLKKKSENSEEVQSSVNRTSKMVTYILPSGNKISCPSGCVLSTNTSGASGTVTEGNVTYTCRCSDGATSTPNLS